jgi:hypothetical protein
MVLALRIPQRKGYVKVMTITSKCRPDGEYFPISPTKKKPFPIQLRLRNGPESIFHNMRIINPIALRLFSYLKIDSHYEVPLRILKEEVDRFGCQLMLCLKRQGGIRHLRSYLQHREKCQENELAKNQLTQMVNQQVLQAPGVVSDGCGDEHDE